MKIVAFLVPFTLMAFTACGPVPENIPTSDALVAGSLLPAFDRLKQDLTVLRDTLAGLPFHYLDAFHLAAE